MLRLTVALIVGCALLGLVASQTLFADRHAEVPQASAVQNAYLFNDSESTLVFVEDQKQFDKARIAFMQAYALKKHPAVLLNLAHSELQSGHEADAAKHFSMYLRDAKNPSESDKQNAETGLLAAKAVVGEVAIEVETEGADVYVDGTLEGRSPLPGPAFVDPGTHTLEAKKDGRTASAQVTASAGQATSASLRFEAKRAPAAARPEGDEPSEGSAQEPDTGPSGGRKPFFKWVGETPVAWVGVGLTTIGIVALDSLEDLGSAQVGGHRGQDVATEAETRAR